MCGIVGFTGHHQAAPILLEGLSRLEYRGYDSAGIAVRNGIRAGLLTAIRLRPMRIPMFPETAQAQDPVPSNLL